jgi:hypothetical protein
MGNFDEFFPWDPGYGASANATRWRKMAQLWASDGVRPNYPTATPNCLTATIAGTQVTVNPGACYIHGYYAELVNAQTLTASGNGTVVAQADLVNEQCVLYFKAGATDYSGYEQDFTTAWEMPLWLVSGGVLYDLRVFINPGAGINWWINSAAAPVSVSPNGSSQNDLLVARVPYAGIALITGQMTVTFTDLSQLQTATCSLTYQYGVSGQQYISPAQTPGVSGGLAAGQSLSMPVAMSAQVPVTQGRKMIGWRVTAGPPPGTSVQLTSLTLSMTLMQQGAAN